MTECFMFWQYASELFTRPGSLPLATPQPIPRQAFTFKMVKMLLVPLGSSRARYVASRAEVFTLL